MSSKPDMKIVLLHLRYEVLLCDDHVTACWLISVRALHFKCGAQKQGEDKRSEFDVQAFVV
jgi:hypothetical protein